MFLHQRTAPRDRLETLHSIVSSWGYLRASWNPRTCTYQSYQSASNVLLVIFAEKKVLKVRNLKTYCDRVGSVEKGGVKVSHVLFVVSTIAVSEVDGIAYAQSSHSLTDTIKVFFHKMRLSVPRCTYLWQSEYQRDLRRHKHYLPPRDHLER